MANGHGGYRRPTNPAPVSGPGAHSARTDGGPAKMDLANAKYGENATFQAVQSGAPLGAPAAPAVAAQPAQARPTPTPLGAPTSQPDQPVTSGADAGPGPSADVLGIRSDDEVADLARRYGRLLPMLVRMADNPTASDMFRSQVRYLVSKIG